MGQTSYYHYDGLGSTQLLTDSNGNVTDSYAYTAFGEPLSTGAANPTPNPFRFGGQSGYYLKPDSGDYYVRARTYSPVLARWLSVDPAPLTPSGVNAVLYMGNQPLTVLDPSGMAPPPSSLLGAILQAFLAGLGSFLPAACGNVCVSQFYGAALPGNKVPLTGFREGMFLGAVWVDNGCCNAASNGPLVHVRLLYTTFNVFGPNPGCDLTAENELNPPKGYKGPTIMPVATFPNGAPGCTFVKNKNPAIKKGIQGKPYSLNPSDCTTLTFEWACPIWCVNSFCKSNQVTTKIMDPTTSEAFWVQHNAQFYAGCCTTFPCSASLQFQETIGSGPTMPPTPWGCWEFVAPEPYIPRPSPRPPAPAGGAAP